MASFESMCRYAVFVLIATGATVDGVLAQNYPIETVRVIVPFGPGGGSDLAARMLAKELSESFRHPFVIENRPGAGALVGAKALVDATPDGHTLMISTSSWLSSAALTSKPAFNPLTDLMPIVNFGYNVFVLAIHPSLPVKTTRELIALARSKPGDLAYGHPGTGSITHLSMALLLDMAKVSMLAVPYKSGGAVMPDVMSGRTQAILSGLVNVVPHAKSGKLRLLGISVAERSRLLPDVPPISDTVPGYNVASWFGVVAPKATPQAVISLLNSTVNKITQKPEFRKNADAQGLIITGSTTDDIVKLVRSDYARWKKLAQDAHIKID